MRWGGRGRGKKREQSDPGLVNFCSGLWSIAGVGTPFCKRPERNCFRLLGRPSLLLLLNSTL